MTSNRLSVIFCAGALATVVACSQSAVAQAPPPAPVAVAEAVEQQIAARQTFVATVMPLKRAVVGSAVDGRVVELKAHEGDRVVRLQPLAQLLTATIELELAAAEAELDLRTEQLAELENGSRPGEIAQAKAKMLVAEANMKFRNARLNRLTDLRATSRAITDDEWDEAQAAASAAEQTFYDAKAAYELAVEGPRQERIAQARAQVAMQQALVDRIKDRIKKYTVISRFNGYVVAEHVDEGAWVQTGDPVMEVVALDEVEVEAFVTEKHVPHVVPGAEVRVEVPALPDETFIGHVAAVIPQANRAARTFPVKVRVDNTIGEDGPLLKSGMYARIELPTGERQLAVMVPKDAVVLGGRQPTVFVVETQDGKGGKVSPVPVEFGVAEDEWIQVRGDVQPGQLVVTEGNERLRPGQEVTITRNARSN